MRLALLASGRGSNVRAILEAAAAGRLGRATPVVLACNVPGAPVLALGEAHGLPTLVVDHRGWPTRAGFERALLARLAPFRPDLVALAGFMRLLSPTFLAAFPRRVINIHPSLLPALPGLRAQRAALRAGLARTGCTVHLVDEGCDTGPILARAEVPVLPGDDEERLAARILVEEHRLYPRTIADIADGRLSLDG